MSGARGPGLDWPAMLRAGICGLGLGPDEFWRLTPAELLLMLGTGGGPAPLGRRRLEELLAAFPDQAGPAHGASPHAASPHAGPDHVGSPHTGPAHAGPDHAEHSPE